MLVEVPRSGIPLELDDTYEKLVLVRRRRWSYRLVYQVLGEHVIVHYIDPAWRKRRSDEVAPR